MRIKSFRPNDRLGRNAVSAAVTKAVVASSVELSPAAAVGAVGEPVNAGLASGALSASAATTLVANAGSLLIAAAILFRVLSPVGAPPISAVISA